MVRDSQLKLSKNVDVHDPTLVPPPHSDGVNSLDIHGSGDQPPGPTALVSTLGGGSVENTINLALSTDSNIVEHSQLDGSTNVGACFTFNISESSAGLPNIAVSGEVASKIDNAAMLNLNPLADKSLARLIGVRRDKFLKEISGQPSEDFPGGNNWH